MCPCTSCTTKTYTPQPCRSELGTHARAWYQYLCPALHIQPDRQLQGPLAGLPRKPPPSQHCATPFTPQRLVAARPRSHRSMEFMDLNKLFTHLLTSFQHKHVWRACVLAHARTRTHIHFSTYSSGERPCQLYPPLKAFPSLPTAEPSIPGFLHFCNGIDDQRETLSKIGSGQQSSYLASKAFSNDIYLSLAQASSRLQKVFPSLQPPIAGQAPISNLLVTTSLDPLPTTLVLRTCRLPGLDVQDRHLLCLQINQTRVNANILSSPVQLRWTHNHIP